jgi:hypothetical protein
MYERCQRQSCESLIQYLYCFLFFIQVIQKFLESPLAQHSVFVATFQNHVYELATHPYGCRVLQRCFEHVQPELVRPLLNELHQRTLNLMQDQYGVSQAMTTSCLCTYYLSELRDAVHLGQGLAA